MGRRAPAVALAAALLGSAGPAAAHHLGVILPRDDAITASFKRMKVFLEQRRADLLRKEFAAEPAVLRRMAEADARYRTGLKADTERALAAGDVDGTERALVRLFCLIAREKVTETLGRLARPDLTVARKSDQGIKLMAAAWRYYNLVDFRVSAAAPKISSGARVAFDEGEAYLGKSAKGLKAFDEGKARDALTRFQDLMTEFLALPAPPPAEARRP
jgi:hypothetical protein